MCSAFIDHTSQNAASDQGLPYFPYIFCFHKKNDENLIRQRQFTRLAKWVNKDKISGSIHNGERAKLELDVKLIHELTFSFF